METRGSFKKPCLKQKGTGHKVNELNDWNAAFPESCIGGVGSGMISLKTGCRKVVMAYVYVIITEGEKTQKNGF